MLDKMSWAYRPQVRSRSGSSARDVAEGWETHGRTPDPAESCREAGAGRREREVPLDQHVPWKRRAETVPRQTGPPLTCSVKQREPEPGGKARLVPRSPRSQRRGFRRTQRGKRRLPWSTRNIHAGTSSDPWGPFLVRRLITPRLTSSEVENEMLLRKITHKHTGGRAPSWALSETVA